ncbi:hypothetical protein MKW98_023386, partial [Papaver atlanticum]
NLFSAKIRGLESELQLHTLHFSIVFGFEFRFTARGGKMKLKAMLPSYMSHLMYQFGRITNLGPILVQDDDIRIVPKTKKKNQSKMLELHRNQSKKWLLNLQVGLCMNFIRIFLRVLAQLLARGEKCCHRFVPSVNNSDIKGFCIVLPDRSKNTCGHYTSNMPIILPSALVSNLYFTFQVIQYKLLCTVSSCIYVVSLCCVL